MPDLPFRVLPRVTPQNEHFWRGGADGELRFLHCAPCDQLIHPPAPLCPVCLSKQLRPRAVSGRAKVATFTLNHQPWVPSPDHPYAIAIVEIEEQPDVRLMTNIVGCAAEDVAIGMDVAVRFEQHEDVYIPVFAPGEALMGDFEGRVAITGIGQSQVGRRLGRDPLELTLDACIAAIEDAGLTRGDIDGLATYPGNVGGAPGFSGAGVPEVQDALRLSLDWFSGGMETSGQLGSVINACLAVAGGLATHVLCFRSVWEATAQGKGGRAPIGGGGGGGGQFRASGPMMEFTLPFRAYSAANWVALFAQRHFHEYGTTREQLAQIALTARANAAANPAAIYRDPMTLDDYLAARMISTPFCLFDCDVPVDGATAVIVSRAETARDLRRPPLRVEAVGSALRGRPSWDQFDDLTTMALRDAGAHLWERTSLRPADVDVAELYDGFSFLALAWLEALGFCPHGEGGRFIEGGKRIARDGALPLNTNGGQLSAGRLHGYGFLHEACVQLWGEGGARQVGGDPRVAVAAAGGGPLAGCLLLTRP